MNTPQDIRTALADAFVKSGVIDKSQIAWENREFKPIKDKPYIAFHFMPGEPVTETLGERGLDRHAGIIQFDLNYLPNVGEEDILAAYEKLNKQFVAGRYFTSDQTSVMVRKLSRTNGRIVGGFYVIYASLYYQAFLTRLTL